MLPIDKLLIKFQNFPDLPKDRRVKGIFKTKKECYDFKYYVIIVGPDRDLLGQLPSDGFLHSMELTFGIAPLSSFDLQRYVFYQKWARRPMFIFRGREGDSVYLQDQCGGSRRPSMACVIYSRTDKQKLGEIRLFRRKIFELKLFTIKDLIEAIDSGRLYRIQQGLLKRIEVLIPDTEKLSEYLLSKDERLKGLAIRILLNAFVPSGLYHHLRKGNPIGFVGEKPVRLSRYQLAKCFKPYSHL